MTMFKRNELESTAAGVAPSQDVNPEADGR